MEIYNKYIDRIFKVETSYIKTKKFRIRVNPDLTLHVTAPKGTKEKDIEKVLDEAKVWIAKSAIRFENSILLGLEKSIESGNDIYVLGKNYRVEIFDGASKADLTDDTLRVFVSDKKDSDKVIDKWWRIQAESLFTSILSKQFPVFKKMGCTFPTVSIKKMHTRWGSCNKRLCKINLNYYLYSLPVECIEYVIMHELVHLIYHNHQREFYNFLSACMPDWKDRKKIMDDNYLLCRKS